MNNFFKAVFAAVMLLFACVMAFACISQTVLRAQIDDLTISLSTNQARERKQTFEYNEVVAAIPLAQAELDALQPKADAAAKRVSELKEQRKALRNENKALQQQVDEMNAGKQEGDKP